AVSADDKSGESGHASRDSPTGGFGAVRMASVPGARVPVAGGRAAGQRGGLLGGRQLAGHDQDPAIRGRAGLAGAVGRDRRLGGLAPARGLRGTPPWRRRAAGAGRPVPGGVAGLAGPNLPDWRGYLGIVRLVGAVVAAMGAG